MQKYSQSFIIGWSIGFSVLVIFNLIMFLSPVIYEGVIDLITSLDIIGILIALFFWPVFLAAAGLAFFGMIIAIVVDIIVLSIFYVAQKTQKKQVVK